MSFQAQIVMLLWLPIVFIIFKLLPLQKAIVVSFIGATLFLPQRAGFAVPGLPDYSRMTATCLGIFIAVLITVPQRIETPRLEWLDIPIIIWCISPFFSSMSNERGIYDGIAQILEQSITYGIPYFLGRRYLANLLGLRQLGVGMFVGGLIYIPFCLFESRMSPVLHRLIYGYHGNREWQVHRLGGYRPVVFMQHGLSVGMWMMAATLVGIWLWRAGVIKKLWGIPISFLVLFLLITFVLVRSTGAYFYLIGGLIILVTAQKFRTGLALSILMLGMCFYLFLATTGNFTGDRTERILATMQQFVPADRVASLEFRWQNEELLIDKALEKPLLGWGGYGDNRVYNEEGEQVTGAVDSFWISTYGNLGIIGLLSLYLSIFVIPVLYFFWQRFPARTWFHPTIAPAAVIAVTVAFYMMDSLFNYQPNPVFPLASGALVGVSLAKNPIHSRSSRRKTSYKGKYIPRTRPI